MRSLCTLCWIVSIVAAPAATFAGDLGSDWIVTGQGQWIHAKEFRPIIKQAKQNADGRAVNKTIKATHGAWRCVVEPAPHTVAAGMIVLADSTGQGGLQCVFGATGHMRGFALRAPDGKTLWIDEWAPWMSYEPCLLEVVVDHAKARAQLFTYDGQTLLSQSDWIPIDAKLTDTPGHIGLLTEKGIARFWGWRIASKPLSEIRPDAPNKLRIVADPDSPWLIDGGMWQWTAPNRKRIRQTTNSERSWAFNKNVRGKHRRWSCRVKVSAPAGGAGMAFQSDGTKDKGLLCWLGGKYGAGCLMLYDLSNKWGTRWASVQDKWHYDTEYVLVGETKPGHARVQMLAADGKTVIAESPWLKLPASATDREGIIGFHSWKGPAEFSAFDAPAAVAQQPAKSDDIGNGWTGAAAAWKWADPAKTRLAHTAAATDTAVNKNITGIHGQWQCTVSPAEGSTASLLFQVSADAKTGFAGQLKIKNDKAIPSMVVLPNRTLWTGNPVDYQSGTVFTIQATSTTDRIRVQIRAADGKLLADSDEMYVSDKHNTRTGHLGLRANGKAAFSNWALRSADLP
jgi:hypothetical protein